MVIRRAALTVIAASLATGTACAEEGMFTYDHFPAAEVGRRYGFTPDQAWLDHVRLATVRLTSGCSGSFVSPDGLVLTNHHCARACINQLSGGSADLLAAGFVARVREEERKCPEAEINQLLSITDVTPRIRDAGRNAEGAAHGAARQAEIARIERACATAPALRCDVVSLYQGARYHLYRYRRFQDVRLVFAPEFDVAAFGGDPDNFRFPRYTFDMTLLRVYVDGKPLKAGHWLPLANAGPGAQDLTFVAGNPATTSRQATAAELAFERDHGLPRLVMMLSEMRGLLLGFGAGGAKESRIAEHDLLEIENGLKVYKGRLAALREGPVIAEKRAVEALLRQRATQDPTFRGTEAAWGEIDAAISSYKNIYERYFLLEGPDGAGSFNSTLLAFARQLVRAARQRAEPEDRRLRDYSDAAFPAIEQRVLSDQPVNPELERIWLGWSIGAMRDVLTVDDPLVGKILGDDSPTMLAEKLVAGTRLGDVAVRRALLAGGNAAIEASTDPMIRLARAIEPEALAIRARFETMVAAPLAYAGGRIAELRFAVHGTDSPPDATRTPRIGYGKVEGWTEKGAGIAPFTTLDGVFRRATGSPPFRLPPSWIEARTRLDPEVGMNFTTSNDIVGGNSGSPIFNRNAELVGLAFDGNGHAIGGEYGFDEARNRCIVLNAAAIREVMGKVYGADGLVREMSARGSPHRAAR